MTDSDIKTQLNNPLHGISLKMICKLTTRFWKLEQNGAMKEIFLSWQELNGRNLHCHYWNVLASRVARFPSQDIENLVIAGFNCPQSTVLNASSSGSK